MDNVFFIELVLFFFLKNFPHQIAKGTSVVAYRLELSAIPKAL